MTLEAQMERVRKIHDEFLYELFGDKIPEDLSRIVVSREAYTKARDTIEKKYGLRQGHPDYLLWVLQQLSRSPYIEKEEEV